MCEFEDEEVVWWSVVVEDVGDWFYFVVRYVEVVVGFWCVVEQCVDGGCGEVGVGSGGWGRWNFGGGCDDGGYSGGDGCVFGRDYGIFSVEESEEEDDGEERDESEEL